MIDENQSADGNAQSVVTPKASSSRLRRWFIRIWVGVPLLLLILIWLHWYTNRPFDTQYRFIHHLRNERFDEAKAMIDSEELQKIPDLYWEQFRGRPPESLISPTLLTLFNGRMSMKPAYLESVEDHRNQLQIRFEIYGHRMRVAEMYGSLAPRDH